MQLAQPRFGVFHLAFQFRDQPVLEFGGALQVGLAVGLLDLHLRFGEFGLRRLHRLDRLFLVLPAGAQLGLGLAQVGELLAQRLEARLRGVVGLLAERRFLDLQLLDPPRDLVDLGRHRVDLDLQPRGRLVDQVDRLVGEEAVGDVALRERRRGDDRRVGDPHAVVLFVAPLQPAQDRDRVLHVGLADQHRLEAPLQRRVLLDVLAVLVERRRADRAQLAARQHRLQQVGRVDRAFGGAGADDRVELVEEEDDPALRLLHLVQHRFQPLLELAAVFRARQQRADVERDHAPVAEALRHVAVDDPLRQPLDDRRLADAGVADQHRVVLGPPGQHLDHAADLLVAADHRVELARARVGGQVAAEFLQGLGGRLGVGRGDRVGTDLGDGGVELLAARQDLADVRVLGQRPQQVVGRDQARPVAPHFALGDAQGRGEAGGEARFLGLGAQFRQRRDGLGGARRDRRRVGADPLQDRDGQPLGFVEQRHQQVRRRRLGIAMAARQLQRRRDRFLRFLGELVGLHQTSFLPSSSLTLSFSCATCSSSASTVSTPTRFSPWWVISWIRRSRSTSRRL